MNPMLKIGVKSLKTTQYFVTCVLYGGGVPVKNWFRGPGAPLTAVEESVFNTAMYAVGVGCIGEESALPIRYSVRSEVTSRRMRMFLLSGRVCDVPLEIHR